LDHAREVRDLTERIVRWTRGRPDVRGVALVGSWARDEQRPDSDLDVVVLTDDPDRYIADAPWADEFRDAELIATRDWGGLTEQRLRFPSGLELELELGVAPVEWASTEPLDPGTRQVVRDGMRVLHDPDQLLAKLAAAC
jgi:uncharacterized protein